MMGELIMFPGCSNAVEIQGRGAQRKEVKPCAKVPAPMSRDDFVEAVAKRFFESKNRGSRRGFDDGKKTWDVRGIDGRSVLGRGV